MSRARLPVPPLRRVHKVYTHIHLPVKIFSDEGGRIISVIATACVQSTSAAASAAAKQSAFPFVFARSEATKQSPVNGNKASLLAFIIEAL